VGKFMVVYRADPAAIQQMTTNMSPEQAAAGMEAWQQWAASCGPALVDLGSPLGPGSHLEDGSAGPSTTGICGFSIMEADSTEAVTEMLKGHPHFRSPGNPAIEVVPYLSLPGM